MLSTLTQSEDEVQIHGLLQHLADSWNDGDAARYAEPFIEDAKYITFFGAVMKGRQGVEDQHRTLFADAKGRARLHYTEPPTIQFLQPDVALVVVTGGVNFNGKPEPDPDKYSTFLYVVVREADRWRFASFQNTRRGPVPQDL